jgi:hypothetical protein
MPYLPGRFPYGKPIIFVFVRKANKKDGNLTGSIPLSSSLRINTSAESN